MNIFVLCEVLFLLTACTGTQKTLNIQDLLEKFLKTNQTSWRPTNSVIESSNIANIKVDVLSTYVLNGSIERKKSVDCSEILKNDPSLKGRNGVYTIYPDRTNAMKVFCDMTTKCGGWTAIQKRVDGSTNFYRTWKEYKEGFGNRSHDYWIGNDVIHQLTKNSPQKLRVGLQRFSGEKGYAEYSHFAVGNEDSKYKLTLSGYIGTIGDSLDYHNGMMFSTKDQDSDKLGSQHCANDYYGGWWYNACHYTNLNGLYAKSALRDPKYNSWRTWISDHEALKTTVMMIRPKKF